MRIRAVLGVGVVVAAAAGGVVLMTGDDDASGRANGGVPEFVQAAVVPASAEAVPFLMADPQPPVERRWLGLELPATAEPAAAVTGEVSWSTSSGTPVSGQVDLQRVDGAEWVSVDTVAVESGSGAVELVVDGTSIYRVVYAGSGEVSATASTEVTVQAGDLLESHVSTAVAPATTEDGEDGFQISASWVTAGTVAISGLLEVQQDVDGEWTTVGEVTTGETGTGKAVVPAGDAGVAARFRLAYPGGARFATVASEAATAIGDDVRTIPVTPCSTDGEIDGLPRGAGCHFTPVTVDAFVVGHDYLDNAWWNALPMGGVVELEGERAGTYEVVDRVFAPGRGAALGSASNWACGDECDVILQTCQGANTGFTWLRRIDG